ncbi:glycerol kinase GlpK [Legionella sp. km772]|uniref:glycerol kinase GlpK n=1 Tax=Legionella sp. km772 TaxID=2498111 RepID=UPI000F8F2EC5|nr:glycerol kinase GlpK [Legionella sp. km772]RUR12192.1 glycerol kinase [Legionella sp. km772]
MNYLLALDQGTSSTRAMLYTNQGELIAHSQLPLKQYYPHPGWVEHNPEEIWQATLKVLKEVIAPVDAQKIITCGITNQRETTLIWNKKTGECLSPAIVWQDRRTQEYCKQLQQHALLIQQKTGLLPDPYFSASKLHWLLENNPEAAKLAAKGDLAFGTIDSFLIWRMTNGAHLTDISNASRTMLLNINTEQWDQELLDLMSIPNSVLPEVKASDFQFGVISKEHLGLEIPITGVAGDQQAALIGQGCLQEGMAKATFGTGGFLLMNTGDKPVFSQHQLLTTVAYKIKDRTVYGLEGSIYQAGTTVKWLRDELKLINNSAETEDLAQSLDSNEGVYFVSSFTGLGAPHWLATSGAMMIGLSRSTNKAHFARAALEGVCYQTREILACMIEDSQIALSSLRVDGGMAANNWFLQFLADQCNLKIQKPNDIETTAKGAAILAGIGCNLYNSYNELSAIWQMDKEFTPIRSKQETNEAYAGWCSALNKIKASI